MCTVSIDLRVNGQHLGATVRSEVVLEQPNVSSDLLHAGKMKRCDLTISLRVFYSHVISYNNCKGRANGPAL